MKIVVASKNERKVAELSQLLEGSIQTVSAAELNLDDCDELHETFVENALTKARNASEQSGLPAIADDSGLCVATMRFAPGVRTARFAQDEGLGSGDRANNQALLQRLSGVADRRAFFVCLLVAVRSAEDPMPLIAQGQFLGEIAEEESGTGGFGYDPVFVPLGERATLAEFGASYKSVHSHRAKAVRQLNRLFELWR